MGCADDIPRTRVAMSSTRWSNDGQPPTGDSLEFPEAHDPLLTFPPTQPASTFDYTTPQTQQFQQRGQNGKLVDGSPAALNAMYHTQNTLPSKRPRPSDDSVGGSPQSFPISGPLSRSQTPQGDYAGFHAPVKGGPLPAHAAFHQTAQHATTPKQPSSTPNPPNIAPNGHHHVHTVSPSPFSPATQHFGHRASPTQSEDGSRVATPQHTMNVQNSSHYGLGGGQSYGSPVASMNGLAHPQYTQGSQHDQMTMDARLRQMNHMAAIRGASQHQTGPFNPNLQFPHQMSNLQMAQLRAQQGQQGVPRHIQSQQILNGIMQFTRARQIPFNPNPVIAGRSVNSVNLFFGVVRLGGSGRITQSQQWPHVAQLLQYPANLVGIAGQELQNLWQTSLVEFERHWYQTQQTQRHKIAAESTRAAGGLQQGESNPRTAYFPQGRNMMDHGSSYMHPSSNSHSGLQSPSKQISEVHAAPHGPTDGSSAHPPPPSSSFHSRVPSLVSDPTTNENYQPQHPNATLRLQSGKVSTAGADWAARKRYLPEMFIPRAFNLESRPLQVTEAENEEMEVSVEDQDVRMRLTRHGGLPIDDIDFKDSVASLLKYKARVASLDELEAVDIRALTMCLRSGIRGEIRHALDTVILLSEQPRIYLDNCDDLVEALVECANDQIDFLAEHASEVSDAMLISSYEDTIRGCKSELEEIQNPPEFGTLEHDLEKAVEKLVCVTAICRNSSFFEGSHRALADSIVLKMMATVIEYLGTRNMVLRSHRHALNFTKDVVIFLSQIAHRLDFQDKDEALCILHFLLSFAPLPELPNVRHDRVLFTTYTPLLNPYLPNAINAFAKLFVRERNRIFYRSIFQQETSTSLPFELLTRAFAFAISPVPETSLSTPIEKLTNRIPFIAQGLLVAEALISMIPNSEHTLASSWLKSVDEFGFRLMKMITLFPHHLNTHPTPHPHVRASAIEDISDPHGHVMVSHRGLMVLKKLIEKGQGSDSDAPIPGTFPSLQIVLSALEDSQTDSEISRLFCLLRDLGLSGRSE